MTEYKPGSVMVKGINLNYYRAGNGTKTLVLLHGATDNAMCWKRIADMLASEYEVILPDAQGHGLSGRIDPGFAFVNHAHQTAALIRELGIKKPVLMGHSMGGSTAANVAGLYPDLPGAVILEDPGWMERVEPVEETQVRHNDFTKNSRQLAAKTVEELVAHCRNEHPAWHDVELKPWAESKRQFDPDMFALMKIDNPYFQEIVPKIICPVLLITADNGIVSDSVAEKAMELSTADVPLQHIKIMGAGHNIRREQFEQFCSAVTEFLRELR